MARSLGTVLKTSGDITAVLKGKGEKTSGFRDFEKVFFWVFQSFWILRSALIRLPAMTRDRNHE